MGGHFPRVVWNKTPLMKIRGAQKNGLEKEKWKPIPTGLIQTYTVWSGTIALVPFWNIITIVSSIWNDKIFNYSLFIH